MAAGVSAMKSAYATDPGRLLAYLTPCASGERYEVGEEVAVSFPQSCRVLGQGKYLLDLAGEVERRLLELGLRPDKIERAGVCSITDERCHSYRRDGTKAGRMAAFIEMKEES